MAKATTALDVPPSTTFPRQRETLKLWILHRQRIHRNSEQRGGENYNTIEIPPMASQISPFAVIVVPYRVGSQWWISADSRQPKSHSVPNLECERKGNVEMRELTEGWREFSSIHSGDKHASLLQENIHSEQDWCWVLETVTLIVKKCVAVENLWTWISKIHFQDGRQWYHGFASFESFLQINRQIEYESAYFWKMWISEESRSTRVKMDQGESKHIWYPSPSAAILVHSSMLGSVTPFSWSSTMNIEGFTSRYSINTSDLMLIVAWSWAIQ